MSEIFPHLGIAVGVGWRSSLLGVPPFGGIPNNE